MVAATQMGSGPQTCARPATSYAFSRHGQDSTELSLDILLPCGNPAEDLRRVLAVLASAKLVNKQDVDWQAQLQVRNKVASFLVAKE